MPMPTIRIGCWTIGRRQDCEKRLFLLVFRLICTTFDLRSKVLSLGNEKKNGFFFCISLAYSYLCTMFRNKGYRLPAEWEPQSGVQLTWPHAGTDWAPMLDEIVATYQEMAREIAKREPLLIVAPEGTPLPNLKSQNSARPKDACYQRDVRNLKSNDTWARDHGFICLTKVFSEDEKNVDGLTAPLPRREGQGESLLLDFCFNGWGEKFPAELDNAINRQLYDEGCFQGDYVNHLDFVLEGGSIESDGKGTIFTTTCCLLAPHRNQPLTKDQIEQRMKDYLCADRVLWIDHGQLIGDDTDGHIDTLVRICPDDTLLYIGCDDPHDERLRVGDEKSEMQYEELRLMEQQLRTFRTIDGRPYRLLRLPMPRPILDPPSSPEGDTIDPAHKTIEAPRGP